LAVDTPSLIRLLTKEKKTINGLLKGVVREGHFSYNIAGVGQKENVALGQLLIVANIHHIFSHGGLIYR